MHLLRQTSYVVVRLDGCRRTLHGYRLNHVGIDSALCKPFRALKFLSFLVEDFDEVAADNFALLFRISHPCKICVEAFRCVYAYYVKPHTLILSKYILKLIGAEQTVVDEDTLQVMADSLIEQYGSHSGIHTARESENYLVVAKFLA